MATQKKSKLPEAGIGIMDHWFENEQAPDDSGLFSHYAEPQEEKLPEAGLGLFDHWFEFDE